MAEKIENSLSQDYKYGFSTEINTELFPFGINETIIRQLSQKKQEPDFVLEWRLAAYHQWCKMAEPHWAKVEYATIDYQKLIYYAAPATSSTQPNSLAEVDPKLLATYQKLGIPLAEQAKLSGVAVDAIFDSVSVATTFQEKLAAHNIIFCPLSEAIREYPELVRRYLGTVVPNGDNFFAALNAAVFSDGSFVYIPKNTRCPMELSTYFRINAAKTGQFERTLIIVEENSYVSYLEGCSAPQRDENQLHAAVVELIAMENAEIRYSTVQNWYPGDQAGRGGIYNFVTKRGECRGKHAKISWTQVETGSALTWKYPSTILRGDNSSSEFYSVTLSNHHQQADTGTKMIHLGNNTTSTIVAKGIASGVAQNTYRGLVKIASQAHNSSSYSQCDSLLIGNRCGSHTFPRFSVANPSSTSAHEATVTRISEEQLFYCRQRGITKEQAITMIVNGFCRDVFQKLPLEFAVEAYKLIEISLEGIKC